MYAFIKDKLKIKPARSWNFSYFRLEKSRLKIGYHMKVSSQHKKTRSALDDFFISLVVVVDESLIHRYCFLYLKRYSCLNQPPGYKLHVHVRNCECTFYM